MCGSTTKCARMSRRICTGSTRYVVRAQGHRRAASGRAAAAAAGPRMRHAKAGCAVRDAALPAAWPAVARRPSAHARAMARAPIIHIVRGR